MPTHEISRLSSDHIIEQYTSLVERIAYNSLSKIPLSVQIYDNIQIEDLIQDGFVGLLEAAKRYNSSKGSSFDTFAGIRIHGSIIDGFRKTDWTPRSVHKGYREINSARHDIEKETGKEATPSEVIKRIDMSSDEYHEVVNDYSSTNLTTLNGIETTESYDATVSDWEVKNIYDYTPLSAAINMELNSIFSDAVYSLSDKEKLIFTLSYDKKISLKEIGSQFGVSESRASQLRTETHLKLKKYVDNYMNPRVESENVSAFPNIAHNVMR